MCIQFHTQDRSQFFVLCFSGIIIFSKCDTGTIPKPVILILFFHRQLLGATASHTIHAPSVRKYIETCSCLQFQKRQYGSAVAMCVYG